MEENDLFDNRVNKAFVGNTDMLAEWLKTDDNNQEKALERIKLLIKNYLELDNVSFLFGSGSSIYLGAVSIRNFPVEVEEYINTKEEEISTEFVNTIKHLQNLKADDDFIRDGTDIKVEYEKVLNYLIAKDFTLDEENAERKDKIKELIIVIKEGLFTVCNIDTRKIPTTVLRKIVKQNKKGIFKPASTLS